MGRKCQLCGYNKCVRALHFHHIDPSLKEFNISSQNSDWTKIQIELDKCILVCSNCHMEIHSNLISKETIQLKHQIWIENKQKK
jgi:predicted HNH restriction endonuclease